MKQLISMYKNFSIPYRFLWIGGIVGVLIDVSQNYTFHISMRNDYAFSWFLVTTRFATFYLTWILLAPIIYKVADLHTDIFQQGNKKSLFRWILKSLLISFIHLILYSFLFDLIVYFKNGVFANWFERSLMIRIAGNFFASFTYYLLIAAIFFFHIYLTKYIGKERELNKAKLNALLMQLRPHFLFNTLHSINTLIDLDGKAAKSMVTKLGSLLRQVIQSDQEHLITFEEELAFIKNYLDIEQVRFQDRLSIYYEIEESTLSAKLPKLILQPIVENTIKHGIAKLTKEGEIRISSQISMDPSGQEKFLQIEIRDNGPGFKLSNNNNKNGSGIGLQNVASRLKQHYNSQSILDIKSPSQEGAIIRLIIPFETNNSNI